MLAIGGRLGNCNSWFLDSRLDLPFSMKLVVPLKDDLLDSFLLWSVGGWVLRVWGITNLLRGYVILHSSLQSLEDILHGDSIQVRVRKDTINNDSVGSLLLWGHCDNVVSMMLRRMEALPTVYGGH